MSEPAPDPAGEPARDAALGRSFERAASPSPAPTIPVLALRGLGRTYRTEAGPLTVLRGVDLDLYPGEIVGLLAPSGSGKSTLLHLAGLLERPDEGEVYIEGRAAGQLSDAARTALRREAIGFVYQFHHLLGEFTAIENVILPQLIAGRPRAAAEARARDLLALVGLEGRLHHLPGKLSGGEQQRVAIARALANGPRLLLADEPTGNLDLATAERVFEVLLGLVRTEKAAALIATHNPDLAARMDRRVTLIEGRLHPLP
jgi:lipoprotein-releasing system ATP-binding protein